MNLFGWLKMLRWNRRPEPEAEIAHELSKRIGVKADELSDHFSKYQRSRDPFAAMMADMYNRDQLSRLHRSNKP